MAKYVPPHLRNRQAQTEAAEEAGVHRDDAETHINSQRNGYHSVAHSGGSFSARSGGGRVGPSEAGGRFDCLKQGFGGGGNRDTGGKGGPKNGGRDGDWYHRADGRRMNGWDSMSEYAIFGDKRSNTGINFDDYDKIPVKVTGRNIDANVKIEAFAEANLAASLFDNLVRCGYERPTPVQKHSIAIVCDGRDVMACAQTGSGKTCAFMVPAIECLLRSGPPLPPTEGRLSSRRTPMPCVLVMAPTRELTVQIFEESRKFAYNTGIRCCVVYGGADMRDQRRELNGGCDVLVATPGRLNDMFDRGLVSLAFIQFLILDEADRMLDMGFEPQVRKIVEETDMSKLAIRPRQSMMFSATFPREVQMMARDFLADYVFLTVGRVGSASELVEQIMQYTDEREKAATLEGVFEEHLPKGGLALVFVETKRGADDLERELYRMGMPVTTIHGDRSQYERESALASFRSGRTPILVATDVASRGLDIPNVHVVVNYDMPNKIDDYVHRIGRTGRAGRKGKAIAFVNERVGGPLLRELRDVLLDANQDPPSWFEAMCRQTRYGGGGGGGGYRGRKGGGGKSGNRSGKGGGGGGHRFGGRDARYDFGGSDWR